MECAPIYVVGTDMKELCDKICLIEKHMNTDILAIPGNVYDSYSDTDRNIVYKNIDKVIVKIKLKEDGGSIEIMKSNHYTRFVLIGNGVEGRNMILQFYNQNIVPNRIIYRYMVSTIKDENIYDITRIYVPVDCVSDVGIDVVMTSDDAIQTIVIIPMHIHHIVFHGSVMGELENKYVSCEIHEILNGEDIYSEAYTGFPYQKPDETRLDFDNDAELLHARRFSSIMELNKAFRKPSCTKWIDITSDYQL